MTDDPKERQARAIAARQFTQNPLFSEMFDAVSGYLEDKALSCDPDSKEQTQRVILAKQILAAMRREIERRIDDGEFARFELDQLEKRGITRIFRR